MKSSEIREAFLNFFQGKQHKRVESASLVPQGDQTLLFTNAGMNQFKDSFLGKASCKRATTAQRCVRAGGKHNDLENVGYTARHHTFFEMLGNFSFGDYFKREAINFAWTFLTQILKLPENRLWITVYDEDKEAENIWLNEMKIDPARLSRLGKSDNFWSMGDTGPCGPCSEIFYDHGEHIAGDPPGGPNDDGDRYVEIWNMVFMEYDQSADGSMRSLPAPSIDTGMGLERISAVMQGVHNNYDIDIFQEILAGAESLLKKPENPDELASLRVIADHIRSCAFLIADGISPSNEGRGYVLRRIIRRACRHGNKLGAKAPFFFRLLSSLILSMGPAADIISEHQQRIADTIRDEEESFARTLDKGMQLLTSAVKDMEKGGVLSGEIVFRLYDTYGFPLDLTRDVAREHQLLVDEKGYEEHMEQQRSRARSAGHFSVSHYENIKSVDETVFSGYGQTTDVSAVCAIWQDGRQVDSISDGEKAVIVIRQTPFYAESGGQVGDTGYLDFKDGSVFIVTDTQKVTDYHVHVGYVKGQVRTGADASAVVDEERRISIARNHSATHLLHAALCQVIGGEVQQKGSLVQDDHLRFDFSSAQPVSFGQLCEVERIVNHQVMSNSPVRTDLMPIDEAIAKGAKALFTEKYDDHVRVLSMGVGGFSVELCGGTHVKRTGDIGCVRILSESGIAAGIRRIIAVTGGYAYRHNELIFRQVHEAAIQLKTGSEELAAAVERLLEGRRALESEVRHLKQESARVQAGLIAEQAKVLSVKGGGSVKILICEVKGIDAAQLRDLSDQVKNRLGECICVLAAKRKTDKGVQLIATVSGSLHDFCKAGDLIKRLAADLGGKGGGRADFAQGAGKSSTGLSHALCSLENYLHEELT